MTLLDKYRAKAQAGGGTAWIEEILIRGTKAGGISGAHVRVGWEAEGVDGKVCGVTNALPLATATADPLWEQLCQQIGAAALDALQSARAELTSVTEERDTAQSQVLSLQAEIAHLRGAHP
jgi:hypothetical protein